MGNPRGQPLPNQQGSALLLMIISSFVIMLTVYTISQYVLLQKKQTQKNWNQAELRLALQSIVDYNIFALKQKWCLSSNLLPDTKCDLSHPRNIERILMSATQEQLLKQLVADGKIPAANIPTNAIRLNEIQLNVNTSDLIGNHPLSEVAQQLLSFNVGGISIQIEKNLSTAFPTSGYQTYINLTVSLTAAGSTTPLLLGANEMSSQSLLFFNPRELAMFSLIIPGSLYLDKSFDASVEPGSSTIHQFSDSNLFATSPGLVFISPIFINKNLILPTETAHLKSYTPVTFAEKIYFGDGQIRKKDGPFSPAKAGISTDALWTDIKSVGGLLKGVENDGARDGGLDVLAQISAVAPTHADMMQRCIERNLARSDRSFIANSKLISEIKEKDLNKIQLRLGFDDKNEFSPQEINSENRVNQEDWSDAEVTLQSSEPEARRPLIQVQIELGEKSMIAHLDDSSTLSIKTSKEEEINKEKTIVVSTIKLQTSQVKFDSFLQPHLLDLNVEITNPKGFAIKPKEYPDLHIKVIGYDATYVRGQATASNINKNLSAFLNFSWNENKEGYASPNGLAKLPNELGFNLPASTENVGELSELCNSQNLATSSQAFGASGWDVFFTSQSRTIWNYAGNAGQTISPGARTDVPLIKNLTFSSLNSRPGNVDFQVYSIVENCIVKADAQYIIGFFTCDNFVIEARATPLTIIGTIIASKLRIDPAALQAGITWGSIYSPQSTAVLRNLKILKPYSDTISDCDQLQQQSPVWHPIPSMAEVANRFSCNVVSLRAKSDLLQWTTVDPDCGKLTSNAASHVCKRRTIRHMVVELSRESKI